MHHYPHHIGDFNNATRHLTRVERSLYRDAIDMYYDTEQPLPGDDFDRLAKRLLAVTEEEKEALRCVLGEFFTLEGGCYHNARCDEEIAKYRATTESKRKAGKASAATRQQRPTPVQHVLNECATNQEPRTKNQEPKENRPSPAASVPLPADPEYPKPKAPTATRLPSDWELPEEWGRWAERERSLKPSQVIAIADQFKDFWIAKPGKEGRKLDWQATWRNWIRSTNLQRIAA